MPTGIPGPAEPIKESDPIMNNETTLPPAGTAPEFRELDDLGRGRASTDPDLSLLMDLTLPVVIELGRTRMTIEEVLALGRGSVVELDRLAGEPVDIFVADRRFAEGEVVVVGEQFGVRVTRILPAARRGDEATPQ